MEGMKHISELIEGARDADNMVYKTGFDFLDKRIGGYRKDELTIVMGGINSGKSAFIITQLNRFAVDQEIPTLFVYNNMKERDFIASMAAYYCSIRTNNILSVLKKGYEYQKEVEAYLQKLNNAPLYVLECGDNKDKALLSEIEMFVKEKGVKVVFLDEMPTVINGDFRLLPLQELARRLHIPIVATLTTFTLRDSIGFMPTLNDLAQYHGFHEVDVVIGLTAYDNYNAYDFNEQNDMAGDISVHILKIRGVHNKRIFLIKKARLLCRSYPKEDAMLKRLQNENHSITNLIDLLELKTVEED